MGRTTIFSGSCSIPPGFSSNIGGKPPGFPPGTTVKPNFLHLVLVQLVKKIELNINAGFSKTGKCYAAGFEDG